MPYWHVLNSYLSVKTKAQTIVITEKKNKKKRALKGVQKLKKSLANRQGLTPKLSWLTTICLRGFDRMYTAVLCFSLHQCL